LLTYHNNEKKKHLYEINVNEIVTVFKLFSKYVSPHLALGAAENKATFNYKVTTTKHAFS
jgi:hypothetical protein